MSNRNLVMPRARAALDRLRARLGAWLHLVFRFGGRRTEPEPEPAAAPPGPLDEPRAAKPAKRVQRALERRRRRHDKFVTPQGPLPVPLPRPEQPRPKPQPRPPAEPPASDAATAELFIADRHHEDSEDVLYKETELYGEFNFRDTILQQLERYFVYLARMRKHDPESYAFYRQVGATLLPYVAVGSHDLAVTLTDKEEAREIPLADWFNRSRPAFGCIAFGTNPEVEKFEQNHKVLGDKRVLWMPKFLYYKKYQRPPMRLQPRGGGDIYMLTVWWDRPFDPAMKKNHGVPQQYGIFVSRDGKRVEALRHHETRMVDIKSRRDGWFSIPERGWRFPHEFEAWAKVHGLDVRKHLVEVFLTAVQKQEYAQFSMVRVAASKGDMTAVFGVNEHRISYFFQDRDISLTVDGRRKRIFHIVRPHRRKDGALVKFHFRGQRQFTWGGYQVLITVPGRDHIDYEKCDVGAVAEEWREKGEKYLEMNELGKRFADYRNGRAVAPL